MNTALWIAAALLALFGGVSKTFIPKAKLARSMGRVDGGRQCEVDQGPGLLELLAAVGLILPARAC